MTYDAIVRSAIVYDNIKLWNLSAELYNYSGLLFHPLQILALRWSMLKLPQKSVNE